MDAHDDSLGLRGTHKNRVHGGRCRWNNLDVLDLPILSGPFTKCVTRRLVLRLEGRFHERRVQRRRRDHGLEIDEVELEKDDE